MDISRNPDIKDKIFDISRDGPQNREDVRLLRLEGRTTVTKRLYFRREVRSEGCPGKECSIGKRQEDGFILRFILSVMGGV